jgi:hypothetical protein
MPVPRDHAIANRVRTILQRRWIDVEALEYGCVNGVVYVYGELRRASHYPASRSADSDELLLMHALARDLRAIPGVKDVRFDTQNHEHGGNHWERNRVRTA